MTKIPTSGIVCLGIGMRKRVKVEVIVDGKKVMAVKLSKI
jgi:hypothetical protein